MVSGGVLLDTRDPLGSGDRRDVVALREQPGQRHLRRRGVRLGGDGLDLIDDEPITVAAYVEQHRANLHILLISCNVTSTALARDLATVRNFTVACYAFPIG